jgi:hypothetical protein
MCFDIVKLKQKGVCIERADIFPAQKVFLALNQMFQRNRVAASILIVVKLRIITHFRLAIFGSLAST